MERIRISSLGYMQNQIQIMRRAGIQEKASRDMRCISREPWWRRRADYILKGTIVSSTKSLEGATIEQTVVISMRTMEKAFGMTTVIPFLKHLLQDVVASLKIGITRHRTAKVFRRSARRGGGTEGVVVAFVEPPFLYHLSSEQSRHHHCQMA